MSHRQVTLLRIRQPIGKRLFISSFRERVAVHLGNAPLLFHRAENGSTLPGLPHVRFLGGKSWLGVAFDPGYTHLLDKHMGDIVGCLAREWQEPAQINVESVTTGVEIDHIPRNYWVREMAIKRRGPSARDADIKQLAEKRLLNGLIAFDRHMGFNVLPDDPERVKTLLAIEIADVIRPRGLRLSTTDGIMDEYVTLLDLRVLACANLLGYWWVGNLTSRGYGRLFKDLQSEAVAYLRKDDAHRAFVG